MYPPVVTKDPTAVAVEVQSVYRAIFPLGDPAFVPRIFGWVTDCFTGQYQDYQPIDAPYHDLEHSLQGTLCMARLLRGWHEANGQPPLNQRMAELGLIAILLHDAGYLKRRNDTDGTGAKYTVTHVARGADFAAELLREKGFSPAEILSVRNMIQCTDPDDLTANIVFASELEKTMGYALGTADLLGQMAAEDYVDKLPVLHEEFAEAAQYSNDKTHSVALYSSAEDLMRKTPAFWETIVKPKLTRDFGGAFRYLNHPYPDGPNWYLKRIEANIERMRDLFDN